MSDMMRSMIEITAQGDVRYFCTNCSFPVAPDEIMTWHNQITDEYVVLCPECAETERATYEQSTER